MTKAQKEAAEAKAKAKQDKKESVSSEDFTKLVGVVGDLAKSMVDLKNDIASSKGQGSVEAGISITDEPKTEEPEKAVIPPKWRSIVDKYLGVDFGLNVVYPESGKGFLFKLIVPLDKSNADKDHLDFYKVDVRTRSIGFGEGENGIEEYCKIVKANLKLEDRDIKRA